MSQVSESVHDVVIVGAGSAGCVIARRLVDAGLRVALLEAGPRDDDPRLLDPLRYLELPLGQLDWSLQTTPQPALGDRVVPLSVGKVLGGSSTINGMIFVRGSRADFDGWAADGAHGWSFDEVLPYFRRLEHFDGSPAPGRGDDGPLGISSKYELHPAMEAFREAAVQAGMPVNPDHNAAGTLDGVGQIQFNIRNHDRHSAATAFLGSVSGSPGLTLRTGCVVERLVMEGTRCLGVLARGERGPERFLAEREVVLSAGTYGSPKLLLLSGIGPADELAAHGIQALADLPGVGASLQDHVLMPTAFEALAPVPPPEPRGTTYQVTIFTRSRPELEQPDLQLMPLHIPYVPGQPPMAEGLSILVMLVRPSSRGSMRLASADPAAAPIIDPNLLGTPADFEAMVRGVEIARELAAQPALSSWCGPELFPGDPLGARAGIEDALRRHATSFWHPAGTCRMGADDTAVVDPDLRVRGISGLRVADASIMPAVVSANTNATAFMIGERAAELVAGAVA